MKADFRLARRAATVGWSRHRPGYPGHVVERRGQPRPRRFEDPAEFKVDRPERQGAPGLRTWGPLLSPAVPWPGPRAASASSGSSTGCRTSDSPRSTTGRPGDRRFEYEPTWVLRGLHDLHIEFTPTEVAGMSGRVAVVTGLPRASAWASPSAWPRPDMPWPCSTATARGGGGRPPSCPPGAPSVAAYEVDVADRGALERVFADVRDRARPGHHPGHQCRHRVLRRGSRHHPGEVGPHPGRQPDRDLHLHAAGGGGHASPRAGAASSPSPRRVPSPEPPTWPTTWRRRAA